MEKRPGERAGNLSAVVSEKINRLEPLFNLIIQCPAVWATQVKHRQGSDGECLALEKPRQAVGMVQDLATANRPWVCQLRGGF